MTRRIYSYVTAVASLCAVPLSLSREGFIWENIPSVAYRRQLPLLRGAFVRRELRHVRVIVKGRLFFMAQDRDSGTRYPLRLFVEKGIYIAI